jgi:hypothetical protein
MKEQPIEFTFSRTIADLTYKELLDHLDDVDCGEGELDTSEVEAWLEEVIADNLNKRTENAEQFKKLAHLALYFIDFVKEPGKGFNA